jgi:hypothetical protein
LKQQREAARALEKEQEEDARALEKGLEQSKSRAKYEARTRNKDKRRALTRAAIAAKKGETKAKAAQQVVFGPGKTRGDRRALDINRVGTRDMQETRRDETHHDHGATRHTMTIDFEWSLCSPPPLPLASLFFFSPPHNFIFFLSNTYILSLSIGCLFSFLVGLLLSSSPYIL